MEESALILEILALRIERFNKKVPFHQFMNKIYFYIVTNFNDRGDKYSLFHILANPIDTLLKKCKPTKLLKREDDDGHGNWK